MIAVFFFLCMLLVLSGTSYSTDINYGKWNMQKVEKQYVLFTAEEKQEVEAQGLVVPFDAPESCPRPIGRVSNDPCVPWFLASPLSGPKYKPYSFLVHDYGYTFIETIKEKDYDTVHWGWKLTVSNQSKHPALAYAHCSLSDKNDFFLTGNKADDKYGSLVYPGEKVTIQSDEEWIVNRNTKPYPPKRVSKMECYLLLRHPDK